MVTVQKVDFYVAVFIESYFADLSMLESMKTAIKTAT